MALESGFKTWNCVKKFIKIQTLGTAIKLSETLK